MQFAPSSYGQPHTNFNASSQYQFTPQMHAPDISSGRQLGLSSESQSTAAVAPYAKQPSVPTTLTSVKLISFYPIDIELQSSSTYQIVFMSLCYQKIHLYQFVEMPIIKISGNNHPS